MEPSPGVQPPPVAGAEDQPVRRRGRPPAGGREAILAATIELLRELGAARLTTREVAQRAGVSEGSVFYHFGDRAGLLTAVIEDCVSMKQSPPPGAEPAPPASVGEAVDGAVARLEAFLDTVLLALVAAQADVELRERMSSYMQDNNLGPHRGVEMLAEMLRAGQQTGAVRGDLDPEALAMMLLGSVFLRVSQRQMVGEDYVAAKFPDRDRVIAVVRELLQPRP